MSPWCSPASPLVLTEEDDDADEDGDDGSGAQAGGRHGPEGGAVPVLVAGAHLDLDDRPVGQRRVPRVRHDDGHLVDAGLQIDLVPQPEASVVACAEMHLSVILQNDYTVSK